jgi:hypothetical protein
MTVVDKTKFTVAAGCDGKMIYSSMPAAQRAADRINKRSPSGKARAYHCPACLEYHIGRTPERPSKKRDHDHRRGKL